jgi:hypothetical protein
VVVVRGRRTLSAGHQMKFLVRDQDTKFTRAFDNGFTGAGIRVLRWRKEVLGGLILEYRHAA